MREAFLTSGLVVGVYLYIGWCLRWAAHYVEAERPVPIADDPELFVVFMVAWPLVLMLWLGSWRKSDR